jgi:hypothetical protein
MKPWNLTLTLFLSAFYLGSAALASGQEKAVWRDFISVDGEFKVNTPNELKQLENGTPGGNPESPSRTYGFGGVRPYLSFSIRYTDYEKMPEVMEDSELKSSFDKSRDSLIKGSKGTLVSESDVALGGNIGREIVIKAAAAIHTYRMFLVSKRFYQAIVSMHIAGENKKQVTDERQRFLDSFSISRIAGVAAQIPDNYQGAVKDDVYRSEFLDFSIDLVKNWRTLNENETDLLKESTKDFYRKDDGALVPGIEKSFRRSAVLLMQRRLVEGAMVHPNILISVETTNSPGRPLKDTVLIAQNTQIKYSSMPFTVTKDATEILLNGEKVVTFDALQGYPGTQLKQRFYMGMRKKMIMMIVLSYLEESDLKTLEKAVNTINFGKK